MRSSILLLAAMLFVTPFRDRLARLVQPAAMMKGFALPVALVCLSGCTALRTPHEQAWLALHAVDTAQTLNIVDDPCWTEGDPVTRDLIGADPSRESVIAWSVGSAALHAGVTALLLHNDYPTAARVWQYLTLGEKAAIVGRNIEIGVRIGGSNKTPAECVLMADSPPRENHRAF